MTAGKEDVFNYFWEISSCCGKRMHLEFSCVRPSDSLDDLMKLLRGDLTTQLCSNPAHKPSAYAGEETGWNHRFFLDSASWLRFSRLPTLQ